MTGDRQLVRNAVAAYFGGALVTTDAGVAYQGGPLAGYGLGTSYPYAPKGVPDQYYFEGRGAGAGWGAVMGITRSRKLTSRKRGGGMGGPASGYRNRFYAIVCTFVVISQEPHLETAEAGLDDLLDQAEALIYASRNLNTINAGLYPNPPYAGNRLPFAPDPGAERGRYIGAGTLSFEAVTTIAA